MDGFHSLYTLASFPFREKASAALPMLAGAREVTHK